MSRLAGWRWAIPILAASPVPAAAQTALEAQTGAPPERIDIKVEPQVQGPLYEDCSIEQDAAVITGEIIVCRRDTGEENRLYDKESAQRRHAEKTQGQKPVDLFGIPDHGVAVARGCFIPPCPRPMPVLIDVAALPEAPPGSDADRIARGLPPLGRDRNPATETTAAQGARAQPISEEELGLPPAPHRADTASKVSPSGSASPAEGPSG